jgi:hypothetical protein
MLTACPHCQRQMEYSGEPPRFCAYCGRPLRGSSTPPPEATAEYSPDPDGTWTGPATERAPPPSALGGYRLLRKLGEGGMGSVYEAEDSATGQRVAVKLLTARVGEGEGALERFRQEGRLASQITHPRCVFVLAADEEAGVPYIVMELTPGTTLKDLVERDGPLPPLEAVERILDVIDGLQEAHRLGVIHRDVKPSNCFVMPDGSVKVGDFGLSKSLTPGGDLVRSTQAHLTRSGAFLGTILFAAPEQIRGEPVDYSCDVYSVCATLYYLLTGRAPFEGTGPSGVWARIISEDPPPVRRFRPEVPRGLERVVMRGLERNRDRRWPSLDELRAALAAQVPARLGMSGLGIRFSAMLIDTVILAPLLAFSIVAPYAFVPGYSDWAWASPLDEVVASVPVVLYFTVLEGWWGWSVGKLCLRLRVCRTGTADPPGLARALGRSLLFAGLTTLPYFLDPLLPPGELLQVVFDVLIWPLVGLLLIVSTMRRRNGFRGPHELLSGTRVLQLPWPVPPVRVRRPLPDRLAELAAAGGTEGLPPALGPFTLRGWVGGSDGQRVALGEDPLLRRPVLVVLRPGETAADPAQARRRQVGRPTRPRWLAGGTFEGQAWDAYLAPRGAPLPDLVGPQTRLSWAEIRTGLEQLTDELVAADRDGTLPARLDPDQLWIQPDGRVQLLDRPLTEDGRAAAPPAAAEEGEGDIGRLRRRVETGRRQIGAADAARSLDLLRRAAVLALEGAPRPPGAAATPVRAPVPPHAARMLDRLLGVRDPYRDPEEFQSDLLATRSMPTAVNRGMRAGQLGVQAIFLAPGLLLVLLFAALFNLGEVVGLRYRVGLVERARELSHDPAGEARLWETARSVPEFAPSYPAGRIDEVLRDRLDAYEGERQRRQAALTPPERYLLGKFPQRIDWREEGVSPERAFLIQEIGHQQRSPEVAWWRVVVVTFFPLLWVLSAFVFRGGWSYSLLGLRLVGRDGRKAPRWRCAVRSLAVWVPPTALLVLSVAVQAVWLGALAWHWPLLFEAVATLIAWVALALRRPERAPHDWLAGTSLMPR